MFDEKVVASGGQFGKAESQTWGSCSTSGTSPPTATPTIKPSEAPSTAPTSCAMPYELTFTSGSTGGVSWEFVDDNEFSTIEASGSEVYSPGAAFTETGCLPANCYRFEVKNSESYILKVDGKQIANANQFENAELSLFGKCQSPMI